jgi:hypothetical protein
MAEELPLTSKEMGELDLQVGGKKQDTDGFFIHNCPLTLP